MSKEAKEGFHLERITQLGAAIKQGAVAIYNDLEKWFSANQRRGILTFVGIIGCVALFSLSMVVAQAHIRQSEYEEIIHPQVTGTRIKPLDYDQEDDFIAKKKAVSVMFAPPHGDQRNKVDAILAGQNDDLNRDFYYYPLVYNTVNIGKKYGIDPTKITFVFFEKGVEKNRLEFSKLEEPETALIPELNRLSMWNIKTIDEK